MPTKFKRTLGEYLEEAFDILLRGGPGVIDTFLDSVKMDITVPYTNATSYCHCISLDGNGRPRVNDLARFLVCKIVDYSIPRSQINKAQSEDANNETTYEVSKLIKKATTLFSDIAKSGEGGELLLYVLTQEVLKIPQILCKMPLKTSASMHYHGVDGIHGSYDKKTNKLLLFWGESKLHKTFSSAVSACFESIYPMLYSKGGSVAAYERDLQLIHDNLDLAESELEQIVLTFLDKDNPNYNKVEYRGVCLIGFDSKEYPALPNKVTADVLKQQIEKNFDDWNKKVSEHIQQHNHLETFVLHVFLLPFPSVDIFRQAFKRELGI